MNKIKFRIILIILVICLLFATLYIVYHYRQSGSADSNNQSLNLPATVVKGAIKYTDGSAAGGVRVELGGTVETSDINGEYTIIGYGKGTVLMSVYNSNYQPIKLNNPTDAEVYLNGSFYAHDIILKKP